MSALTLRLEPPFRIPTIFAAISPWDRRSALAGRMRAGVCLLFYFHSRSPRNALDAQRQVGREAAVLFLARFRRLLRRSRTLRFRAVGCGRSGLARERCF